MGGVLFGYDHVGANAVCAERCCFHSSGVAADEVGIVSILRSVWR